MSGTDLAAVVVTIAAVAATTVLLGAAWALLRTLRRTRQLLERVNREAAEALVSLQAAADEARHELGRVDGLLDRADSISATLEDASRLSYLAVSSPVIKAAALASGVRVGARRLRQGPGSTPPPFSDDGRQLSDEGSKRRSDRAARRSRRREG
ncbi:MAG: hypothetical protein QOJ19_2262 [Acidimicrobiia bacterium]|jgi:hypothetical protein|nr:hypothetical protein [Acidimicrobiia bacterium]